jgi:hypothetical protein
MIFAKSKKAYILPVSLVVSQIISIFAASLQKAMFGAVANS